MFRVCFIFFKVLLLQIPNGVQILYQATQFLALLQAKNPYVKLQFGKVQVQQVSAWIYFYG